MNDTRSIFASRATCKPETWHAMKTCDVTEHERAVLQQLPVVQAGNHLSTPNAMKISGAVFADAGLELIILRGATAYYANTEGYSYPRYMFKIGNMTEEDFNG